jgi:hypothetical protein
LENGTLRFAGAFVLGIIDRVDFLNLTFRIVVDHDFQRPQHGHHARGALVQVFADEVFEHRKFERAIGLGNPNGRTEIADRLRRIAAAPYPGKRRHARIVPTRDTLFLHQSKQLALAEQRVGKARGDQTPSAATEKCRAAG